MRLVTSTLQGTDVAPAARYDVALLDLDGVVYVGADAVPGAPDALATARSRGMQLAFVTNNAARPPATVAAHLTELGVAAERGEVITSSQAAARWLADRLPAGALVLVLGTTGLYEALHERGLTTTDTAGDGVQAVVQGYSPDMDWRLLAEGAVAINGGAVWVATNADPTVPSPRGPLPGNGSLVAAMRLATRRQPTVTGKPDPTMHRETLIRTGAKDPIVVGDRLDTDIEGANAVGCDSLLVFSGVTDAADLLAATPDLRPTYIGADVAALLTPHPAVPVRDGAADRVAVCGRWRASAQPGSLRLSAAVSPADSADDGSGDGMPAASEPDRAGTRWNDDTLDALRALCVAWWSVVDAEADGTQTPGADAGPVAAADDSAREVLRRLGLPVA